MPHHFGIGPGLLKFLVDSTGISGHFTLLLISVMTFTFCLLNELNKEEFPLEKYLRETGFFFFKLRRELYWMIDKLSLWIHLPLSFWSLSYITLQFQFPDINLCYCSTIHGQHLDYAIVRKAPLKLSVSAWTVQKCNLDILHAPSKEEPIAPSLP